MGIYSHVKMGCSRFHPAINKKESTLQLQLEMAAMRRSYEVFLVTDKDPLYDYCTAPYVMVNNMSK